MTIISREFFEALWFRGGSSMGFGELRLISKPEPPLAPLVLRNFIDLQNSPDEVLRSVSAQVSAHPDKDAYFGVVPRAIRGGKEADCLAPCALWADIDFKRVAQADALRRIDTLPTPPNIVVMSGGGFHAYWLLKKSMMAEYAKEVMVEIAKRTGGDHVQDISRVLRIPGTINRKYPDAPVARIIRLDTTHDYYPSDMVDAFCTVSEEAPRKRFAWADDFTPTLLGFSQQLDDSLYTDFDPGRGRRSEYIWRFVCDCIGSAVTYDTAFQFFLQHTRGVGAKMAGATPSEAERYFQRTWKKALEALS